MIECERIQRCSKAKAFSWVAYYVPYYYRRNTLLYRRNSFYFYEKDTKSNVFRKNFNVYRKDTIVYNKLKKVFRKYIENMEK